MISLEEGKKIAEEHLKNDFTIDSRGPWIIDSGVPVKDGYVYHYEYEDENMNTPNTSPDNPFIKVLWSGKIGDFSPFMDYKDYEEGAKNIVYFR